MVAIVYNIFYVPFSIALDVEMQSPYSIFDKLAIIVFIFDIFFRARLAINQ